MKKLVSMLLIVVLLLTMIPSAAIVKVDAASAGLTLQQLREKYPHGKYWNHANNPGGSNSVNNQNGYTSTPCSKHGGLIGTSAQTCNGFQPGGTQLSWQCMGYAEKLGYDATGYNPRNNANGWQTYTSSSALNNLKPGDIVRYKTSYQHSIYVTAVNGDTVTFTDCNSDGKCGIRWDKTISKATLKSKFIHLRSAPSSVPPDPTCTCSSSHAGEYVCVTSGSSLNIRNGHGTNYTVIGSIPSGTTVTISKATGTGSNDWGHVTYKGVSGYVSMQYMQRKGSGSNHAETPTIRWWISDSEYGDSISSSDMKVGNRYYFCYRLYDKVTGKNWDDVQSDNYSVKLAIYNPDGSLNYEYEQRNDEGWISIFYKTPGTYTRRVIVTGDYTFDGRDTYDVAANPKKIHVSDTSVNLTVGGSNSSKELLVWSSGYYDGNYVYNYSRSNDNISCVWGDWNEDNMLPLTITAKSPGTATVTLSIKDKATSAVVHSVTVNVTVTATSYNVTYDANGGSGAPSTQKKQNGTALTLSNTIPTRTGYNFAGWATSSSATSASYQPGGSYTSNSSVTLYAVWKQETISTSTKTSKTANITYAGQGVYFKFTPSVTATYRFVGTAEVDNKIVIYNANGTSLASNDDGASNRQFLLDYEMTAGTAYYIYVSLYSSSSTGSFTFDVARLYNISYNANGGSGAPAAQTKVHGTSLSLSTTQPTRSGYRFLGWATSSSATSATYSAGASFTADADTVLYAVWAMDVITYTVSYNANGGTGAPSAQTKIHGTALTLSTVQPTRSGYAFKGWATSATATTATYSAGASFTQNENTTLYAVWQANPKTLTSVQIVNNPTKTTYVIGESLNTSGLKLKLIYSDGSTETVTSGFTTSGFSSATAGTKTVTVSYNGKTASFTVTVTAPTADETAPKVTVSTVNATAGGTVTVDVTLDNNPGIWGMALRIDFDPAKLTLTDVENGVVFSDNEWTEGTATGGSYILYYEESTFSNNNANGVVARLTFTVNENAQQNDFYEVSVSYSVGDIINIDFDDIILEVECGGVEISSLKYGDVNGDGIVNVKDSLLLKLYIVGGNTEIDTQSADVYYDGVVNSKDCLLLKRSLAGFDAVLGPQ